MIAVKIFSTPPPSPYILSSLLTAAVTGKSGVSSNLTPLVSVRAALVSVRAALVSQWSASGRRGRKLIEFNSVGLDGLPTLHGLRDAKCVCGGGGGKVTKKRRGDAGM